MREFRVYSTAHSTKAAAGLLTAAALFSGIAEARVPDVSLETTTKQKKIVKLPASIDAKPEFDIRTVPSPKATGMELAAKLSADGGTILRPVQWIIYGEPADAPKTWKKLHDVKEPSPRFDLAPGRYVVQTVYDKARTARRINVVKDKTTVMTVTLNVGALRVLSRIATPAQPEISAEHTIYKLEGINSKPRLIAKSATPGALMRVSAGSYKVVSRYLPGNSVVNKVARVQPGMISPVQLDHNAGVARLFATHAAEDRPVSWVVTDSEGEIVTITSDRRPALVLRAGSYTATATTGGIGKWRKFEVKSGANLKIEVGS